VNGKNDFDSLFDAALETPKNEPENSGQSSESCAVVLEDATRDHVPEVAALEQVCFSDPWKEIDFRAVVGSPHVYFRVALMGDRVAGYLLLIFAADAAELANIAVDPSRRRCGIGAALLDDAIAFCRRRGIADVTLEVRESNAPARSLYASRGFVDVGRRRGYYKLPREDAIVMLLHMGE